MTRPSWAPIQLPRHRTCLAVLGIHRMLHGTSSSHLASSWGVLFSLCRDLLVSRGLGGLPFTSSASSPMGQLPGVSSVSASHDLSPTWLSDLGACPLGPLLPLHSSNLASIWDLVFFLGPLSSPNGFAIFGCRFSPFHSRAHSGSLASWEEAESVLPWQRWYHRGLQDA